MEKNLKEKFSPTRCEITDNELDCDDYDEKLKIEVDGDTSIKGIILFENNMITQGTNFILNDYIVKINEEDELTIKPILAPKSFNEDSWETIIANVRKGNIDVYKSNLENDENNTKEITLKSDDTNISGTYTVRIANTSTPTECNQAGFSQSACGFVIEFVDIITIHNMNPTYTNLGGWPASDMYKFLNDTTDSTDSKITSIYESLPQDLQEVIKPTQVVSSHGSDDSTNFTSTDKLYLLSTKVWGKEGTFRPINDDTAEVETRQLDYYKDYKNSNGSIGVTTSNISGAIKNYNGSSSWWWLRSARSGSTSNFYAVAPGGHWDGTFVAASATGVSPAFRVG